MPKDPALKSGITAPLETSTKAFRSSEARYRRLFEAAQDGILLINADTAQIEDVNPYLISLLGYTHSEFLGKKLWEIGAFADIAESRRMFAELREKGYVRYENLPLLTSDGTQLEVEFVSNTYDCEGMTVVQCNIRDISERRLIEARLHSAEDKFRDVVDQAIAGVLIIQDYKVSYVNPRAAAILNQGGITGMIGTEYLSWVAENDRGKVASHMRQLLDGKIHSVAFEFTAQVQGAVSCLVGANASYAIHNDHPAIIFTIQDITEKNSAEEAIRRYIIELNASFMSTVKVATIISEMRDPYTAGHERRVAEIACAIGAELGLDAERLVGLRVAGHLHDIGKITIPSEILSKPGKIINIEYEFLKMHAQAGYDVLREVAFPWPVALVALQHHERMDGSGYPQKLRGEEILLESRIIAVADVVEAISSHRPYRAALGIDAGLQEIQRGRGTAYDQEVVDACLRVFQEKHFEFPVLDRLT